MIPPCYLLVQNADHGSELTLRDLDFLNLVMMGIKRPLAMKAMHSCSTDRTVTLTELRLILSVPDRDASPTAAIPVKLKGPMSGMKESISGQMVPSQD